MSDYTAYEPANPGTDYPTKIAALLAALTLDTDKVDVAQLAYQFGQKRSTTTGLTYGYFGGVLDVAGTLTAIADGTIALTSSATNYVERDAAGTVSKNTTGFTAGRYPMAVVVAGGASITSVTDKRPINAGQVPPGALLDYAGTVVPAGYLACDGSNVSRATYPGLFGALVRTATVTFDSSTDKVAWTAHGLSNGDLFKFTTSGGAPSGLTAGSTYYVVGAATNDFQVSASEGGSAIDFTTNGTGTHTGIHAPHGDGDGSTTFTLPDSRRRATVGRGGTATATLGARLGATGGAETHTLAAGEMPSHTHSGSTATDGSHTHAGMNDFYGQYSGNDNNNVSGSGTGTRHGGITDGATHSHSFTTGSAGSGGAHNNLQPSLVVTKLIKF